MDSIDGRMTYARTGVRALLLAGCVALAGNASSASAADWGLGVGFFESGSTVSIPIRTQAMMIEPDVTYSRQIGDGTSSTFTALGTGIYVRRELGPLFESYFGGRIGYSRDYQASGPNSIERKAWFVAPTFGVQHFFSKQISLGLDVGLEYFHESDTAVGFSGDSPREFFTLTRVMLRTYF